MNKHALLIGVEHFSDARIRQVHYAENDVTKLEEVLLSLGFEVKKLMNGGATKTAIDSKLRRAVRRLAKDDTFWVFVASHGFSENGHNYVLCHDTQSDDLRRTSLALKRILELFKESGCRRCVMFLDACETGMEIDETMRGHIGELSDDELRDYFDQAEYCVGFAACKTDEKSHSSMRLRHGIWTHCLIQALSGNAKAAIERKRLITSASLQSYLSQEVPRELRRDRGPSATQTPWQFGGLSRDFVVADVGDLLAARRTPPPLGTAQLKRVLLRADETGPIRKLPGFNSKWGHWVPDDVNAAAMGFVRSIAGSEIKADLERTFNDIRKAFRYKRKDIEIYGPNEGSGSIDTPGFTYAVGITQHPRVAREYVLTREVGSIKDPDVVNSEAFNDVFKGTFDTLAFEFRKPRDLETVIDSLEDAGADVDYDSGATYCRVTLPKFPVEVVVGKDSLRLVHSGRRPPRELVSMFKIFRELAAKRDLRTLLVA